MKRIILFMIAWSLLNSAYSSHSLPSHASILFTLANTERGDSCPALLHSAKVFVDYDYNFERNMGLAHLRQLQSTKWSETLYPLGLSNYYAFMSDMKPKTVQIEGGEVTIYRIIFHLYKNGDSRIYLMINQDGECIMSSDVVNVNFQRK
ncbi:TPA: hypothetical protein RG395_000929 [Legionella pneumophila]|uniref:Uncharacterized protein n=1 Tax=Legionella pneumophila TaxID=446 RepID=A0AAN5KRL1_LEGPN|nr:hypothetical protein [Legionella pneumophila]MDW8878327.1 hypothetical protein [Legionella pneumophila subsp. fraseri]MDW8961931.1 hypothetical protein [Legionella pneumophila subsp. fraseri]MDW9036535.1 hypothetical protein [Legionella pneumophila subsp. fraseri]MDW9039683.1 hypothetical protein [Legionella pneumophila subsp. fraseri]MDW9042729.1 hypothetical protein [Legionella pneumophila subsp. fraseri]